ncbi:hypothetical protein PI126_g16477 [Phytophthora idaei]|nr:hypothetical protein PI126_g16477 [Phytophthora idaei]
MNRNATLRMGGSHGREITNVATLLEWGYAHLRTSQEELFGRGFGTDADAVDDADESARKSRTCKHGETFEHDIVDEDGKLPNPLASC